MNHAIASYIAHNCNFFGVPSLACSRLFWLLFALFMESTQCKSRSRVQNTRENIEHHPNVCGLRFWTTGRSKKTFSSIWNIIIIVSFKILPRAQLELREQKIIIALKVRSRTTWHTICGYGNACCSEPERERKLIADHFNYHFLAPYFKNFFLECYKRTI